MAPRLDVSIGALVSYHTKSPFCSDCAFRMKRQHHKNTTNTSVPTHPPTTICEKHEWGGWVGRSMPSSLGIPAFWRVRYVVGGLVGVLGEGGWVRGLMRQIQEM